MRCQKVHNFDYLFDFYGIYDGRVGGTNFLTSLIDSLYIMNTAVTIILYITITNI